MAEVPVPGAGYRLEFGDDFDGPSLGVARWTPSYAPHWSSRARSAANHRLDEGRLLLEITEDQAPWCPDHDGSTRVSCVQTGQYSGPVGSGVGQLRFKPGLAVTEAQQNVRLYTPRYGYFALRARALADPRCMVALWMIGYEEQPEHSAEICICEIFGTDVGPDSARVGMGVHPFGDPGITDEFSQEPLGIDATQFHVYAAEWTPTHVEFLVDGQPVKVVRQSPGYPMQFMLGLYEFDRAPGDVYPKHFEIDWFRAFQPLDGYTRRESP